MEVRTRVLVLVAVREVTTASLVRLLRLRGLGSGRSLLLEVRLRSCLISWLLGGGLFDLGWDDGPELF
jgi:hypothetical protein